MLLNPHCCSTSLVNTARQSLLSRTVILYSVVSPDFTPQLNELMLAERFTAIVNFIATEATLTAYDFGV